LTWTLGRTDLLAGRGAGTPTSTSNATYTETHTETTTTSAFNAAEGVEVFTTTIVTTSKVITRVRKGGASTTPRQATLHTMKIRKDDSESQFEWDPPMDLLPEDKARVYLKEVRSGRPVHACKRVALTINDARMHAHAHAHTPTGQRGKLVAGQHPT
jgi:hypothetical protein